MRLIVNEIEVKNLKDLEKAMQWENQKGDSASVYYLPETSQEWARFKNCNLKPLFSEWDGKSSRQIGYKYSISNWYNDNIECTVPYNGSRACDKTLSIKYNTKKLLELINEDGIKICE